MRISKPRLGETPGDPLGCRCTSLLDQFLVWNASVSSTLHLFNLNLLTLNLSESTSGTSNLCATASARRLCGN